MPAPGQRKTKCDRVLLVPGKLDRIPGGIVGIEVQVLRVDQLPVTGRKQQAEIPAAVVIHQLDRLAVPGEVLVQIPFLDDATLRTDLCRVQISFHHQDLFRPGCAGGKVYAEGFRRRRLLPCRGGNRGGLARRRYPPLSLLQGVRSFETGAAGGRSLKPHPDDQEDADQDEAERCLLVHEIPFEEKTGNTRRSSRIISSRVEGVASGYTFYAAPKSLKDPYFSTASSV